MSPTQDILKKLAEKKPYLKTKYGVRRLALFGSHASGQAGASSDIDLLVDFSRPIGFEFFELCDYLEKLLGKKVDVLTSAGLQSIRVKSVSKSIGEDALDV